MIISVLKSFLRIFLLRLLYIHETEKKGVRSWIWSDYGWHHPELFFKKMPKSVLQSNWYYGAGFDLNQLKEPSRTYVKFYNDLENKGYDQIPTAEVIGAIITIWKTL